MTFDFIEHWPAPAAPKPDVIIGADGIVRDAHQPAYAKTGLTVLGVTDPDAARSAHLAADFDIPQVFSNAAQATASLGTDDICDNAVPPHVITSFLPDLTDFAAVLMQKSMGADLIQARAIRQICRDKSLTTAVNFQLWFSPMMMAISGQPVSYRRSRPLSRLAVNYRWAAKQHRQNAADLTSTPA